jgi:hypothetical protein
MKRYSPKGKGTKEDHRRDFWICETGPGQKVKKLLDSYMMMMMMMIIFHPVFCFPCDSDKG